MCFRQLALSHYLSQEQEVFLFITGQALVTPGKLGLEVVFDGRGSNFSREWCQAAYPEPFRSQWSPTALCHTLTNEEIPAWKWGNRDYGAAPLCNWSRTGLNI